MKGGLTLWGGLCYIIAGALVLISGIGAGIIVGLLGYSAELVLFIWFFYFIFGFAGIIGGILAIRKQHSIVTLVCGILVFFGSGGLLGFIFSISGILLILAGWDEFEEVERPAPMTRKQWSELQKKEQEDQETRKVILEYLK